MRIQEHIINKVAVDINTNSNKVAEELKDTIDTFLKEEIFPLIESFFESISSEDSIKLIPKLSLDINVSNQNFSITSEASKRELKKQISNKLAEIINEPEENDIEIKEKSFQNSKADTFFSFIENGTFSWWNNQTESFSFSQKDLYEITETSGFSSRFLKVLQTPSQKVRLLNQFLDTELQILFLGIVNKPIFFNQLLSEIKEISYTVNTSETKKEIWNAFIHYTLQSDLITFLGYIIRLFESNEYQEDEQSKASLQLFLRAILNNHSDIKNVIPNEIISKIERLSFSENQKFDVVKQTKNQLKSNDLSVKNKSDFRSVTIQNEDEKISESLFLEETEKLKNTIEDFKTKKDKNQETLKEEKFLEKDKVVVEELTDNLNANSESLENDEFSQKENVSFNLKKDETVQNPKNLDSSTVPNQDEITARENKSQFEDKSLEKANSSTSESINKESSDKSFTSETDLPIKESTETTSNMKSSNIDELKNGSNAFDKEFRTIDVKSENNLNSDENQSITPLKNIKELFKGFNKPKSYIINNAGLILIHPFLKQFFTSCNLLNDKNQIINPSEAIHLLHYVATKQEKQLESNLVFEKFLCNIPIHQTIERDIKLSEETKENAENLLNSVVHNWEILKNSSPDLIRNEFIQRQGKLDLTKDNPQLTIERKTQDILLDKLPWSFGLCKLPWMKTLLFTDW
ncbi:contractile injection system tape measure protein [Tenacibaculum sp. MEBiC06402]|uniref:contractile injection system tape measure protein n=1 Tax=unclassified Tenacibaculum TaxID=2635139 RepID=UPI003B9D5C24